MKLKLFAPAVVACALVTAAVAAAAVIIGTPGDDVLRGTPEGDRISALAGNDAVYARGGGDDVRAGAGNDGVRAADGSDLAYGGRGDDIVAGGDGNDRLYGGSDSDQVLGGNGDDRAAGNKGADAVSGNDGNDSLFGGWGPDRVFGGSGNDVLHALAADGDLDLLNCGPGDDKAWILQSERPRTQLVRLRGRLRRRQPDLRPGRGRERGRRHRSGRVVASGRVRPGPGVMYPFCVHHPLTRRSPSGRPRNARGRPLWCCQMAKVLIIEDDDVIARGMARHLETAGFDAVGVANGETGLARLRYERPDVCVLDLMLPGIDGWRVIEQARDEGIGTPIIVVSARGTEHDRVHALEIGADDYLVKPFSMKELAARVRAAARRGVSEAEPRRGDAILIEELRLDPDNVQAYVDGASAELTPTEFRLIYTLAREQGRVLTRDELLQRVWGRRATHRDRTVDVFVRKLREKVDRRAPRHTFIHTRYGVGYKLEAEPK